MTSSDAETVAQNAPPSGPEADAFRALAARDETQAALRRVTAMFPSPLCTRCIGRPLARAARGIDNVAKGRMVLDAIELAVANDPSECPWCEGLFEEVPKFADLVADAVAAYECDNMLLATRVHPDVQAKEKEVEAALGENLVAHYEPMKTELNRVLAHTVLPRLGVEGRFDRADLVALVDPYFDTVEITTNSVYVYGRYRKYDRTIPQTKWPCKRCQGAGCARCDESGQMYATSVEALVAHVAVAAFDANDESFHGSGREDIDALMLGTGRPFVLELKEPRFRRPRIPQTEEATDGTGIHITGPAGVDDRVMELAELEAMINAHARPRAEVEGLRLSDKEEVVRIKEAALDKAYRAHVVAESPVARTVLEAAIGQVTAAPIAQQTPERVLHRRADKTRHRTVHKVSIAAFGEHVRAGHDPVDPEAAVPQTEGDASTHFTLDIDAESGTYIKELVHGDEGRTQPSFAGVAGVPMRVLALDVVGVGDGAERDGQE